MTADVLATRTTSLGECRARTGSRAEDHLAGGVQGPHRQQSRGPARWGSAGPAQAAEQRSTSLGECRACTGSRAAVRTTASSSHEAGLPCWFSRKESTCQCRRQESDRWSGKIQYAHAPRLLSLYSRVQELQLRGPRTMPPEALSPWRACAPQQEKPRRCDARAPQPEKKPEQRPRPSKAKN